MYHTRGWQLLNYTTILLLLSYQFSKFPNSIVKKLALNLPYIAIFCIVLTFFTNLYLNINKCKMYPRATAELQKKIAETRDELTKKAHYMGRKKRKGAQLKPFCYYCDREFDDEKVLIQHQKAKHFKCSECNRKLDTATGLVVHMLQVHKETISRVPNALNGRDNPEFIIHGMAGVPVELFAEKQQKLDNERGAVKQSKTAHTVFGMSVMSVFFNQMTAAGMPGFGANPMMPGSAPAPMLFNQMMSQFAAAAAANQLNANAAQATTAEKDQDESKKAKTNGTTGRFTANWTLKTPNSSNLQSRIDSKLSSTLNLGRGARLVFDYPDDSISPEELLATFYGHKLEPGAPPFPAVA